MASFEIVNRSPDGTRYFAQEGMGDWAYAPIVQIAQGAWNGTWFNYDHLLLEMSAVPGFPQLYFRVSGHFQFVQGTTSTGINATYVKDGSIIRMVEVVDATGKVYNRLSGIEFAISGDKTTRMAEPLIMFDSRFGPLETPEESNLFWGNDTIKGNAGTEFLYGYNGDDSIFGFGGVDQLNGGAGNDTLTGGADADDLFGGAGNDVIVGYDAGDYIHGGDNFDTWALTGTHSTGVGVPPLLDLTGVTFYAIEAVRITWGEIVFNSNQIGGTSSVHTVYAGSWDRDMLRVVMAPGATVMNLSSVDFVDWNNWSGEFDLISLYGTAAADTIDGSEMNDTIFAFDGANTVRGGHGSDEIHGGAQADILRGGDGYDDLHGGGGNDILIGDDDFAQFPAAKSGDDTIFGGEGNDVMMGLRGQNVIDGGAGTDTVDYGFLVQDPAGTQVPVHVLIDLSRAVDPANPELGYSAYIDLDHTEVFIPALRDILVGIENVDGTMFADRITGNGAANRLRGRDGNDTLSGLDGNDTFEGGAGADSLIGGNGDDLYVWSGGDRITEAAGGGTDTVRTSSSLTLAANLERLVMTGSSAINATGNNQANVLTGNGAANSLNGSFGNDSLVGGGGNDQFVFNTALGANNVDRIGDFSVPGDTIRLENAIFTGLATGALAASAFVRNTSGVAQDASDRLVYETDTGRLYFDQDGTGAAARVHFATLGLNLNVTNADFFVI